MIRRNNSRQGFTLIELLLVVIILAVILGLAVPNFKQSFTRVSLQQAVNELSYVMRYAQSRAIQKNLQGKIIFDLENNDYVLNEEILDEEDASEGKKFGRIAGRWGRKFSIPSGIKVELAVKEINFFPDGKMDRLRIYCCRGSDCFTVSTKEQTGFVDIYEGRLEE